MLEANFPSFHKCGIGRIHNFVHALHVTVIGLRLPNHLHGILTINEPVGVQNFEPLQNTYQHTVSKSLGSIIHSYKAAVTHECRKYKYYDFRWQGNYYEHIIRNDNELNNIRDYIRNNVAQWAFDKDNPNNIPLW
jgi:REP element-mobilizing transposase RayT